MTDEPMSITELIAAGQKFRGESDQYSELITELADALAAAVAEPEYRVTDEQVGVAMHAVERYYASQGITSVAESVDYQAMRAGLSAVLPEPQYEYRTQHPVFTRGLKDWAYWTTLELAEATAREWGRQSWIERRIVAGPIERLPEEPSSMSCDVCGALTFDSTLFRKEHGTKSDGRSCGGMFTNPRKEALREGCPDGGTCHHMCQTSCWRVSNAGPLSGVFPTNQWPMNIYSEHAQRESWG